MAFRIADHLLAFGSQGNGFLLDRELGSFGLSSMIQLLIVIVGEKMLGIHISHINVVFAILMHQGC